MTPKSLHKLFVHALKSAAIQPTDCKVESVRLRGAVPVTGGTSRQARKRSSIQHDFAAGDSHTQIGFVVFTSPVGVPAALKMNGYFLPKGGSGDGNHIRVDVCSRQKASYNTRNSIFIGNLPFSANEEQVRQVFAPFGKITSVRLVRDSATGAVKGIGFVEFEDASSVPLAIRRGAIKSDDSNNQQGLVVGGRQLRVEAWKSIKKAKDPAKRREKSQNTRGISSGSGRVNSIRVPTNLRGRQARKKFVKQALQKRNKRKQMEVTDGSTKVLKKRKTAATGVARNPRKKIKKATR
ncbi:unnamed protein product [Mesocestoides corti]|nr:unnamed protein product [Mesocestoides corti]